MAEKSDAPHESPIKPRNTVGNLQPTPTQAENDAAAAGFLVDHKEYDGSPLQNPPPEVVLPPVALPLSIEPEPVVEKQSEAKPAEGGGYATRSVRAKKEDKEAGA